MTPEPTRRAAAPRTPAAGGSTRLAGAGAVLLAAAGVMTLWFLLEGLSPSQLPTRTSYVSELMALDQPWSTPFRLVDGTSGLLALAGAVLLWRGLTRPHGRAVTVALVGLAVFGLATLGDAASPMACTPSVSTACADAEVAGTLPLHHTLHSVSSSIAAAGALVALIALAVAVRRPLVMAVAAAFTLVTLWGLVEIAGATPGSPLRGQVGLDAVGSNQRVQIAVLAAGLVLAAAVLPGRLGRDRSGLESRS